MAVPQSPSGSRAFQSVTHGFILDPGVIRAIRP